MSHLQAVPVYGLPLLLIADAVSPLSELGPLAQMGVAGIVLGIWWIERKERRERQVIDDERYAALQRELLSALRNPVRCPMVQEIGDKK